MKNKYSLCNILKITSNTCGYVFRYPATIELYCFLNNTNIFLRAIMFSIVYGLRSLAVFKKLIISYFTAVKIFNLFLHNFIEKYIVYKTNYNF